MSRLSPHHPLLHSFWNRWCRCKCKKSVNNCSLANDDYFKTKQNKSEFKQLRCETQSSDKGNIPLWILTGDVSVSQCTLYSVSLSLHICGNSLFKKSFISFNPLYSLLEVHSKGFLGRVGQRSHSRLSSPHLSDLYNSTAVVAPKTYTPISPWCTTVFQSRAWLAAELKLWRVILL